MGKLQNMLQSVFGQNKKPYPKAHFGRITSEGNYSSGRKMLWLWGGLKQETPQTQKFERVDPDDLDNLDLVDLAIKMVKSDSLLDLTVDSFCTLTTLEHNITAETDRGQRELDELLMGMEDLKVPLSLTVSQIASSLIVRGNSCVERIFPDDEDIPVELLVNIDPRWFEWRQDGNFLWKLGQYGIEGKWAEIDSPHVAWTSVNPLMGERVGRSPIQTAFSAVVGDNEMVNALAEVVETQAFVKRFIQFKTIEMKKAGYTDAQIDDAIEDVKNDMALWQNLAPGDIPYSTETAEWNQEPGAGGAGNLQFVDTIDRVYDRKSFRGAKIPPSMAGSNEFVAESSYQGQAQFYSVRLGNAQDMIKKSVEWGFTGFLRYRGVSDDPIFTTKRVNSAERLNEAQVFEAVMKGIKVATESGIPVDIAIEMYEQESGTTFSADIKNRITESIEEKKQMAAAIQTNMNPEGDDDDDGDDNNAMTASSPFMRLKKKSDWRVMMAQLEDVEDMTERVIPDGAADALPASREAIPDTEDSIREAVVRWDDQMSDYSGMLNATPDEGQTEIAEDTSGNWEYHNEAYSYENTQTEEIVGPDTQDTLSDTYLDIWLIVFANLTAEMILKERTLQSWYTEMEVIIEMNMSAQYLLGIGGRNRLNQDMVSRIKNLVMGQYGFFREFSEEIKGGNLTAGGVIARAQMYAEVATQGYEQGKAAARGVILPEYPADGNQICLSNCRCHWNLVEVDAQTIEATWTLTNGGAGDANTCQSCLDNSRKWNPLIVER